VCDTLADHLNAAFLLIDYQPAQLAAVRSMDHAGGLTVVAVDRNEHALRELPDGVRREVADTTDPSVATPLIDRIAGEVGPPDVLVNIIGAFRPGDALTVTPETLRLMIDVNLGTALWLSPGGSAAHAAAGLRVPSCTCPPARGSSQPAAWPPTARARPLSST
jgi:NAD(P)-dependent dehydrogenase (short-subunit alcohol dehydrogenase family)